MAEPVPEDVYHEAVLAGIAASGEPEQDYNVEGIAASADVRGAIEYAYRAGYADGHAEWCPGCNECGPQEATDG